MCRSPILASANGNTKAAHLLEKHVKDVVQHFHLHNNGQSGAKEIATTFDKYNHMFVFPFLVVFGNFLCAMPMYDLERFSVEAWINRLRPRGMDDDDKWTEEKASRAFFSKYWYKALLTLCHASVCLICELSMGLLVS
jgi:hypothetical protein